MATEKQLAALKKARAVRKANAERRHARGNGRTRKARANGAVRHRVTRTMEPGQALEHLIRSIARDELSRQLGGIVTVLQSGTAQRVFRSL